MTVEISDRPRRGSRARRNSVVQRIAVSIPQMGMGSVPLHHETHISLKKSSSSSDLLDSRANIEDDKRLLSPLTDAEKEAQFSSYMDSFDYDVLPSDCELKAYDDQQNVKYTRFLESCRFRQNNYTELIARTISVIDQLSDLTVKYDAVTKETAEFQSQSDALIGEYNRFVGLNEDLKGSLQYYELLNTITRKLNNPSPNMVRRDSFRRMLSQLDECIAFIENHKDHKEHEMFTRRFKQCLTRALTLIRNYVMNNIKSIRDDISSKMSNSKPNTVTEDAFIYTRFGSDGEFLAEVSAELCQRASESNEYVGLLNDCYQFYFGVRSNLLQAKISDHLKSSVQEKKTLVLLAQSNISYFTKIFKDEHELFFKFFTKNHEHALTNWFQQLAEPLYDHLRNGILREQSLNSLCELATLLDKYYEYDEDEFEPQVSTENELSESELGVVFEPILQDVQSRLVFRAQAFVDEKIVKYRPTVRDFQIGHRRRSHTDNNAQSTPAGEDDASMIMSAPTSNSGQDIYPPLNKGIVLLSKIYQLVSSSVFDDLAHNIVHDCIISLRGAYNVAKSTTSTLDADLFLLRNLLMLRNHVQNFDIEYVSSETFLDFSGVGDIISKIRNGGTVLKEDGFVGLVRESVPKVVRNMIDARLELQTELRNVVHTFTEDVVKQIIEPLQGGKVDTADKDVQKLQENIEDAFPRVKNQAQMFIDDSQVVTALIDGIQELVIQSYETYYENVGYKVVDSVHVVEVDTMVAFIGEVVSRMFEEVDEKVETPLQQIAELSLSDNSPLGITVSKSPASN